MKEGDETARRRHPVDLIIGKRREAESAFVQRRLVAQVCRAIVVTYR